MRRSILLLVTAGLLPIIALGGTFGAITLRNERRAVEQKARTDARFAAALVAVKLRSNIQAVEMLAQSPAFDGELDLARFRTLATRLVNTQADWHTLSVATPAGYRVVDVPVVIGRKPQGRVVEPTSLQRAIATRQPAIGDVVRGPRGGLAFAVRAPIVRDGRVKLIVSAVITAPRLRNLLEFQSLPRGWEASIVDAGGNHVVTSRDPHTPATNERRFESWARVEGTAWSVRISAPASDFTGPRNQAMLILAAAAILCLLLIALLARLLAQDIKQERHVTEAELHRQRMEALGRLTGGVAHDFNNLLTPVLGGLALIDRHVADDRVRQYVSNATASAERAKALVSRLLAYSRQQSLMPRAVDLARLIEDMSDLIHRSLTPSIQLRIDVPEGLQAARADPAQLELAILNLVINARDAMPAGGLLTISAGAPDTKDSATLPDADYVYIRVTDNGVGMDDATLDQAVEPFFTTKPAEKGAGLGLSMVHGFAAQSGGELQLSSKPGKGTAATIILPCERTVSRVAAGGEAAAPLPSGRVLLVDDNILVRHSVADMLRDAGQLIVEAGGVDEALAILDQQSEFDAIVTDFVMPRRSGGELVREVRARWPRLPILLITGYVSTTDELPAGTPVLMKPFNGQQLARALAEAINT